MSRRPQAPDQPNLAALGQVLSGFFDAAWYRRRYPDVDISGSDPMTHFLSWGAAEGRDPNRWFDSRWYLQRYPDILASGMPPLLHYMVVGAAELRNPHPRFDSAWYAGQHPEAANNPLLHHLLFGEARGWATEPPVDIADYLPSTRKALKCPTGTRVDVVVPVYRGLEQTRRCIESVLADRQRLEGRVIVIDDRSPDAALSAWLDTLATAGRITLLRNRTNVGFVASVNRGIAAAGRHDVALLNSDTEVPAGWLRRLAAQVYAGPRIASVSPFSNNATICGYPCDEGGPLPLNQDIAAIDSVCRAVNAGRYVAVPTTVGFCMYIRRAALDQVGGFDADAFGRGYGEENDFCMRASRLGWSHHLACDTFVYHEGSVSFGVGRIKRAADAMDVLARRYPDYASLIDRHVKRDAVAPYRFAVTAGLFRRMELPVILMLSHHLGGGVHRHIDELIARLEGRANVLLLQASTRGAELSAPALRTGALLKLPADRLDDFVTALSSAAISRVHVHHVMGLDVDVRALIHRLNVPFDVTLHDYYALCPQVNLLPFPAAQYCGEPGPAACNACIAARPAYGATDILSWRGHLSWLFLQADRVLCPSEDVRARLERHGLAARAVVAAHETVAASAWHVSPPPLKGRKLRVAVLGVLAEQKGVQSVIAVAEAADPSAFEFHLIGYPEDRLPETVDDRLIVTGRYAETELPALLTQVKPHVVWFPAQWPETYSYTLSAALAAGLPVVASRIGAFVERLEGRPLSWLVDPRAAAEDWLQCFARVRKELTAGTAAALAQRQSVPDFYQRHYLPASETPAPHASRTNGTPAGRLWDLRRAGRTSVVIVPEQYDNGGYTPCAYIRLLLPFDHLQADGRCDVVLASAEEALRYRADIIATQRYAIADAAAIDALAAHCQTTGARLLYDLDDDLLHVPRDHADAAMLRGKTRLVQRLLRAAGRVTVSTPALAASINRADAVVVPNALDERLWADLPSGKNLGGFRPGRPVRLLCMGTATHSADFALIEPALARLKDTFDDRVTIDIVGVSSRSDLPDWANRPDMPTHATATYPGFVNWIVQQPAWDIGLAPLADTAFNHAKSAIKTLDYAALGLVVVASDVPAYRGSLADGPGGLLVANRPEAWYAALSRLVRDAALRSTLARGAWETFLAEGTLACRPVPEPFRVSAALQQSLLPEAQPA